MEMVKPLPLRVDFDVESVRSSPYNSAPSTPRRIGDYYFSAPSSPSRLTEFYREFHDDFSITKSAGSSTSQATVPFDWEEKPGTPKYEDGDFAFDLSNGVDIDSLSAAELFDGGVIRPLKPPVCSQGIQSENESLLQKSLGSPVSYQKISSRNKENNPTDSRKMERERGRGPDYSSLPASASRKSRARSHSPLRISEYLEWEQEQIKQSLPNPNLHAKGSRKWRLRDLFLFRSASDGRAMVKDPLKKYSLFSRKHEDVNSRDSESSVSGSESGSRRKGRVSAHELHYTAKRAAADDMKKKTFLPYKQGILGRLAFNPTVHALTNGLGFSKK